MLVSNGPQQFKRFFRRCSQVFETLLGLKAIIEQSILKIQIFKHLKHNMVHFTPITKSGSSFQVWYYDFY